MFEVGSPLQTRRKITILLVILIMMAPQNGLPEASPLKNGTQWDHCCGFMGSVRLFSYSQPGVSPDVRVAPGLVAGSGKSVLWYVSHKEVAFSQCIHITN